MISSQNIGQEWGKLQKRRLWLASFALVLAVSTLALYMNALGGWVNALGLPPTLDASTPASQNGFALLELQAHTDDSGNYHCQLTGDTLYGFGGNGAAGGVWVRLPPATSFTAHDITATGRASTGETFPLRVTIPQSENSPQFLFTVLPGGYPDAVKYIDLTLTSRQGQTARWRITRLPRMRHVTPPPGTSDTFDQSGARLTLQASREPYRGHPGAYIRTRLLPVVAPYSHQWEVDTTGDGVMTDWAGYPHGARQEHGTMPLIGPTARQMIAFLNGAVREGYIQNPFVAEDHFVTFSGTMTQFETYDERLTFHDIRVEEDDGTDVFTVSRAQTGTTPSGITVTLPAQSRATFMQGPTLVEPGLLLDVSPGHTRNTLPNSPLARIYHRPVGITLDFGKPLGKSETFTGPGAQRKYTFYVPGHKPTVLHDLTVIVRQQVDMQSWPLSLTAPIQDTRTVPDRLEPVPPEGLHS